MEIILDKVLWFNFILIWAVGSQNIKFIDFFIKFIEMFEEA